MDSSVAINVKKLKTETLKEINIKYLNNDCLAYIFKYLSLKDRLIFGMVCKRWDQICCDSWSDMNSLKIDYYFVEKYLNYSTDMKKNTSFVLNIIKKCGFYLSNLTIDANIKITIDFPLLFEVIIKYCNNLTYLKFYGDPSDDEKVLKEKYLDAIFNSNKNISDIRLHYWNLTGYCFLSLNATLLKKLSLCECNIKSMEFFHSFLSRLKNLTRFKFYPDIIQLNTLNYSEELISSTCNAIDSLFMGKCENLVELYLSYFQYIGINNLLIKQKNLRNINFNYSPIDARLLNCIPSDNFENITDLSFTEELSGSLKRFRNLKYLTFITENITDQLMLELSELLNLKEISMIVQTKNLLTSIGIKCFKRLEKIETIEISSSVNLDNVILGLEQCKNLKNLNIFCCNLSVEDGIKNLALLTNLKILDISYFKITNHILEDLIKHLKFLEKLEVRKCKLLTNEVIKTINYLKNSQDNKIILTINFFGCKKIDFNKIDFLLSPLLKCKKER